VLRVEPAVLRGRRGTRARAREPVQRGALRSGDGRVRLGLLCAAAGALAGRGSADALDAVVDLAAHADELELGVGLHDGRAGAGDEEEEGAGGVDVDEDLPAGERELHGLHVHVVLEGRRGVGAPRGVGVQRADDLGGSIS
jgi:hypothetical protein